MLLEDEKKIVPGVGGFVGPAAVDEDGPLARGGNLELADEALALHVARRALVVVVEADFAAGDDFGLGEKRVQLGESALIGFGGAVRIDARARIKARQIAPVSRRPLNWRQRSSAWCISAGPSPMPMESTAPTPASQARLSMASRSSA